MVKTHTTFRILTFAYHMRKLSIFIQKRIPHSLHSNEISVGVFRLSPRLFQSSLHRAHAKETVTAGYRNERCHICLVNGSFIKSRKLAVAIDDLK
ncbi:hypothetical protein CDAR_169531 [Caerostris darwini]|uniref:Uncharacterized protein n=1 Tax=Caerostris darwini TaxID=1538125 RepID=A0AAV4R279_9ARAC|nr:hypothetical protein CDAR_169531 [Caerostris darwini]